MTQNVPSIFAAPPAENPSYKPSATSNNTPRDAPPTAFATPMMSSTNYSNPPPGAGTDANLPQEIRDIAKPRGRVIAWSTLDPAMEDAIARYIFCMTFGVFVLPCFWCHLLCMWPCLLASKVASENAVRSSYWIVTETELKVVTVDHDQCCCPGVMKTGDIVRTIPLENITDCGLDARGTGWANQQAGDVPSIYVDTASSGGGTGQNNRSKHEAVAVGFKDYEWLIQQILHQRDVVRNGGGGAGVVAQSMNRPGAASGSSNNKSAVERIQELTGLRDAGVITEAEFQQQRQAIIGSI